MISYNNNDYDKKSRRKQVRRRRTFHRAVCIILCLFMGAAVFGAVSLISVGKEASPPGKRSAENTGGFSQMNGRQSGRVSANANQNNLISADITAENAIVINTGTDTALYQKNSTDEVAPASTAKMITALTALDYCAPEDELTVGGEIEMIQEDSSRAWLTRGDILTVRQLLIALMLPSGNDAAYTLAVNAGKSIAGDNSLTNKQSVDIFMGKVNEKARALGAEKSNFVVPDGYDAEGQYTTAYDLAVIAKACLDNPTISEIVASYTSYEKWVNGREVTYNNTNELLNPDSQCYRPEVIGLKTGNSSLSGACLISAAVINGETYICVMMRSTKDARFQDSVDIYDEIKNQ